MLCIADRSRAVLWPDSTPAGIVPWSKGEVVHLWASWKGNFAQWFWQFGQFDEFGDAIQKGKNSGFTLAFPPYTRSLTKFLHQVCNHPELFERADVDSPLAFCESARTGSLSKETNLNCAYSTQSVIKYHIPKRLYRNGGILNVAGEDTRAGFETKYLDNLLNVWTAENVYRSMHSDDQGMNGRSYKR